MATARKRGNAYQIRVSLGYDLYGKQIIKSTTWTPPPEMTKLEIRKELERLKLQFEDECFKTPDVSTIKFGQFAEQWFEEYAATNLRRNTYERFKYTKKRVYAAFGHVHIDKITPRMIQRFVSDMLVNGKSERTGKPLSRKTVIHHLSLISGVLGYAERMMLIPENPCRRVRVPKGQPQEKEIYSLDEAARLMELLEQEPLKYQVFFNLALNSGYRRGEILGLEWKDVDWENNLLHIRRTSNYVSTIGNFTDTTKTPKSKRILRFSDDFMQLLKRYKEEYDEERRKIGSKWINSDRLFVRWDGSPMGNQTPYSWFLKFCRRKNFPFHNIHSFRHFYASALIQAGVDPATVSAALGHSSITTTTSIYCHAFQEAQIRACDAITNVLGFAKKKQQKDTNQAE